MNQFLLALYILHFLNDGIRTEIVALLPFLAKDLHLSFTQIGFLGSSQGLLAFLLAFPAGYISNKIGGYKLILTSLLIYTLGTLAIGLSPNIMFLIITFYLTAVGFGMFHVVGFSLVSRISEKTNIGRNLGNFTSIGDIGRIVIPSIAIFAMTFINWRQAFIITALLGVIAFGILQIYSRRWKFTDSHNQLYKNETHSDWLKQIIILLKTKKLLLIISAGVIDSLAGSPVFIFLPFLLIHKGMSAGILGIFIGIYLTGSLLGKSALGIGLDKFGSKKIFIIAEFLMAFCMILISVSEQMILLLFITFLLGIFTKGTVPVITTLFSEVTHSDHYEKVFAISETFLGFTSAIIPVLMGLVADKAGITSVFYITAFFAIMAAIPVTFVKAK